MNVFTVLLSMSLVSAPPPNFTARTVDGRQVQGTLNTWDEAGLTLKVGDEMIRLPLDQLLGIVATNPPGRTASISVTLCDGTVIAADSYLSEAHAAKVTTSRTGVLDLSSDSVKYVRFGTLTPDLEGKWKEILDRKIDRDMLVISHGDSLDYLGGVIRAVREKQIDFDLDGDLVPVRLSKVFAIRYYHPSEDPAIKPLARVFDDAGSIWAVQRATTDKSAAVLHLGTRDGVDISLPLNAVARVDFAGSGLVYLSDLEADSVDWTPGLGQSGTLSSLARLYRPRRNTALDSSPIVLDGMTHEHGLALHTRTEMTYRLTEPFTRFQTLAGIDDRLRPNGNVELKILGDNRVLFDGTIAGTEKAQMIDIGVEGVKTLTIVADFGADLDVGDHLILAEAKLLK